MSQAQVAPQAADVRESETDGRNRPETVDRAQALRELHMSLARAEENLYTVLEGSHGSLASRTALPSE